MPLPRPDRTPHAPARPAASAARPPRRRPQRAVLRACVSAGAGLNTDNQRKKILKDLEERLARTEAKAEQYERKHDAAMKTVNALKLGIQSIFNKIGCNTAANMELLGHEGVTEANMMQCAPDPTRAAPRRPAPLPAAAHRRPPPPLPAGSAHAPRPTHHRYLGIIEQRTNEILQLYAATQAQARDGGDVGGAVPATTHVLGQGPQVPAGSTSISIQPPSTGEDDGLDSDDDSEDDADDRPFSRDELKAKTIRGLHKRESKEKKKDSKRKSRAPGK